MMLVFLAAFPLLYPYLSSTLAHQYATKPTLQDFSAVQESTVSPASLLDYSSLALGLAIAGNFTQAQIVLAYINYLPPDTEYNLRTYLTQVSELISTVKSFEDELTVLRSLVENGQINPARQMISQTDSMLSGASNRLELLYSALDRIAVLYQIDVSHQQRRLENLGSQLTQFRQVLDSLEAELATFDKRIPANLTVSATPNPVWINGTLTIFGTLQSNGMALEERTVEIWINGINLTAVKSDSSGRFGWQYSDIPNGYDTLQVYARYAPTGKDANRFGPTVSETITVPVNYYPVVLTTIQSTSNVHVSETFSVQGRLTNSVQQPLENQTVLLLIDGKPANSSETDNSGAYFVRAYFPVGSDEGDHTLQVEFNPQQGVYARTRSSALVMHLYYVQPSLNVISPALGLVLSGQTVSLTGIVTVDAKPFSQGSIIALLGEQEIGSILVGKDGVFTIPLNIPIDVSGLSAIRIVLSPGEPWIINTAATIQLNVINSGLLTLSSAAFVAAVVTLSQTTEIPSSRTKRRENEQTALQETRADIVPFPPTLHLARLREIAEPRIQVREAYWETRLILAKTLHERELQSETPREFASRVNSRLGETAATFALLTMLFESAEYSLHEPVGHDCLEYASQIAARVNAHVRLNETWSELRDDLELEANSVLRKLGSTALKLIVRPESVSVQVSWLLSEKDQASIRRTLVEALFMPIDLVPVRFCGRCRSRLEGLATKLPVCPECGRRLEADQP